MTMRIIFADAFYWNALLNPRDDFHNQVRSLSQSLTQASLVTTDEILTEVLNFFSNYPSYMKNGAVKFVNGILNNHQINVIPQTHDSFLRGLKLYSQRLDKGYSLTDCISMSLMKELEINEVLTHDKHFAQEGFTILF
jgi:predicted nucleic acid-binding protein